MIKATNCIIRHFASSNFVLLIVNLISDELKLLAAKFLIMQFSVLNLSLHVLNKKLIIQVVTLIKWYRYCSIN